jgi:hypothetical protein
MGRPRKGDKALTVAERIKRHRLRQRGIAIVDPPRELTEAEKLAEARSHIRELEEENRTLYAQIAKARRDYFEAAGGGMERRRFVEEIKRLKALLAEHGIESVVLLSRLE